MARQLLVCIVTFGLLAGCGANYHSIFRTYDESGNNIAILDAKQRVILSNRGSKLDDNGNPVADSTAVRRYCAEPSPDVFSVLGSSLSASGALGFDGDKVDAAANIAAQISEAGSSIVRTQTIQTLRELMYRTCERYLSGAISQAEFKTQAARDQRIIVSILAIEQLTNATRPEPVRISVNSSASAGEDKEAITQLLINARKSLLAEETKLKEMNAKLDSVIEARKSAATALSNKTQNIPAGTPDTPEITDLRTDLTQKQEAEEAEKAKVKTQASVVEDAKRLVADLEQASKQPDPVSVGAEVSSFYTSANNIAPEVAKHVAEAVKEIVQQNLKLDEVMLTCVNIISSRDSMTAEKDFCKDYLKLKQTAVDAAVNAGADPQEIIELFGE